jgi:hypothetical protein
MSSFVLISQGQRHGYLDKKCVPLFSFAFESHGARIRVGTNIPEVLSKLTEHLPPSARPIDPKEAQNVFTMLEIDHLDIKTKSEYHLYNGECQILETESLDSALEEMARQLHATVALEASPWIFVHAGVVGWTDAAIVMPGRSMSGKSSLVMALIRAGATYYSDEYAVFDHNGLVYSYPRPLRLRTERYGELEIRSAQSLGGRVGTVALRVGLIVATHYDSRADWEPTMMSPGEAVLCLFGNTIDALRRPQHAINTFARVAVTCIGIGGPRPSSHQVAPLLLDLCDRVSTYSDSVEELKEQSGLILRLPSLVK